MPRLRALLVSYLVFLIKAEVLKPISFAPRFDKGELPGVRNLSPCRLARGQTAVEMMGAGLCRYVVDRWLVDR